MDDGLSLIAVAPRPWDLVLAGPDPNRDPGTRTETDRLEVPGRHIGLSVAESIHPEHLARHNATVHIDKGKQQRRNRLGRHLGAQLG